MGTPFKLTDMLPLSDTSTKAKENRRISYYDLVPSADNFYSMQDIDELKAAIELAGRVLHNLVVVPQGNGKYTILSGHRRHRAIGELLNEGKDQYEFLPCTVVDDESDLAQQTFLIAANSQREKTAWDKLEEVRQMRDIARKAKEQRGIAGRVRDLVAKSLNVSNSRIAKYDSILNNLIPTLMDEIKADRLPISVAYDLSKRTPSQQQKCFDFFLEHGKLPDAIGGFHCTEIVCFLGFRCPFDITECQRVTVFLNGFGNIRHIHFRHIGVLPCGRQCFRYAFRTRNLCGDTGDIQIGRAAVSIICCDRLAFRQQRHHIVGIVRRGGYCHSFRVHLPVDIWHFNAQHILKRIVHIAAIKIILWDLIGRCPGWHIVDLLTGKAVCTHLNINRIACA